jgi:RNA recognition motif-containing protein
MERTLYIGGLEPDPGREALRDAFSAHGTVRSIRIAHDEAGQAMGFAFVEMGSEAEARAACAALDGALVGKARVKVIEAKDFHRLPRRE